MTAPLHPSASAWAAVADVTGIASGARVLDVGCSGGGFCELAAARGAAVHGVDALSDRIAEARRRVPAGDFRVDLMEQLPWPDGAFDVVTGFNAFQYALDVELALTEACRVASGGRVAISKYGRPADNEFFAFLVALEPHGPQLQQLGGTDAIEQAIGRLALDVTNTGDVVSTMSLADEGALAAALPPSSSSARILTAGAPYRQADGSYRFENRMRYWVVCA